MTKIQTHPTSYRLDDKHKALLDELEEHGGGVSRNAIVLEAIRRLAAREKRARDRPRVEPATMAEYEARLADAIAALDDAHFKPTVARLRAGDFDRGMIDAAMIGIAQDLFNPIGGPMTFEGAAGKQHRRRLVRARDALAKLWATIDPSTGRPAAGGRR